MILLHILLLLLGRYIAWPENFLWSYLHFSGLALYKDIFYIYPPLYFLLLTAFYQLAGLSLASLQAFSIIIIIGTDVLLYFAAKRKIWPVALYLPLQFFFEGNGMWPDQLLAPIFLLAFLALRSRRWFILGLALGLALVTKQTAVYAILIFWLATKNWRQALAGAAVPLGLAAVYLQTIGAWNDFYQQTVVYILSYHAGSSLQQLWPTIGQTILLAVIFLPALAWGVWQKKYLLVALTIAAGLGMFTRFGYFHLQPALPFLALLVAESPWSLPVFFLSWALAIRLFIGGFRAEPKFLTTDVLANAKSINRYVAPGTKTLILTPLDHYYYLTGTRPVGNFFTTSTPWNLLYPGVSERIITALATEKPKFVVVSSDKPAVLVNYVFAHYRLVSKLADGSGIFEYYPVGL